MHIPHEAYEAAKNLMQFAPGNICYGDTYYAQDCKRPFGKEVFAEACRRTRPIFPSKRDYN